MNLQDEIKALLEAHAKELVHVDGAFCTGFFLAAEFYDSNGEYYSYSTHDTGMPPWRIQGLVNYELSTEVEEEDDDYA